MRIKVALSAAESTSILIAGKIRLPASYTPRLLFWNQAEENHLSAFSINLLCFSAKSTHKMRRQSINSATNACLQRHPSLSLRAFYLWAPSVLVFPAQATRQTGSYFRKPGKRAIIFVWTRLFATLKSLRGRQTE